MAKSGKKTEVAPQENDVSAEPASTTNGTGRLESAPHRAPTVPELTPEARAKLAEIRSQIEVSVGQIVLSMMQIPRYRHQTLGDLQHLVLDPLLHDRVAIAFAKAEGDLSTNRPVVGIAIWASVDDAVSAKISEQVKAGTFPTRLAADDWVSGETLWLLDIIAANKKAASAVLANFRTIAGDREVRLHPVIGRSVDPELLQVLRQQPS